MLAVRRFWIGLDAAVALSRGALSREDFCRQLFPQNDLDGDTREPLDPVSLEPLPGGEGEIFRIGRAGYAKSTIERLARQGAHDPLSRLSVDWSSVGDGREPARISLEHPTIVAFWFSLSRLLDFHLHDYQRVRREVRGGGLDAACLSSYVEITAAGKGALSDWETDMIRKDFGIYLNGGISG